MTHLTEIHTCPHCGRQTKGPAHARHERHCLKRAKRLSAAVLALAALMGLPACGARRVGPASLPFSEMVVPGPPTLDAECGKRGGTVYVRYDGVCRASITWLGDHAGPTPAKGLPGLNAWVFEPERRLVRRLAAAEWLGLPVPATGATIAQVTGAACHGTMVPGATLTVGTVTQITDPPQLKDAVERCRGW